MKFVRAQWDRTGAVVAALLGLLALLLGWIGVSGTVHVAAQLPYVVSGGLLGIFLLGVAAVLWLSADLRDEWRELRALRLALRQEQADRRAHSQGATTITTLDDPAADASKPRTGGTSRRAGAQRTPRAVTSR